MKDLQRIGPRPGSRMIPRRLRRLFRPAREKPGGPSWLPGPVAEESATLFSWARERHLWLHLSAFLLFSLVLHGSGFYLFQVVYPPPVPYDVEPDTVSILDRSDPVGRAILREARDRTIFFTPPSDEIADSVRLESFEIRFAPSFSPPELELMEPRFPWSLPPPIDLAPAVPPTAGAGQGAGALVLGGGLENLVIAPWSILSDYLARADALPRLRLDLKVDPSGAVVVGAINPEVDETDRQALVGLVESTLRFLPEAQGESGWIEMGGEAAD